MGFENAFVHKGVEAAALRELEARLLAV